MPGLDETVGLDIGPALDSLDQLASSAAETLGAALTSATELFATGMTAASEAAVQELTSAFAGADLPVTADTSAIPGEVDAALADAGGGTVPVEADVTPAEAAVADLVATTDADVATIQVEADTGDAQGAVDDLSSSIDGLGSSAGGSSGKVEGLGGSTKGLGVIAGLAGGELASAKEGVGLLGETSGVALGGVLALTAGVGELVKAGIAGVSAEEHFTAALGAQAEAVQRVHVGTLDTDLLKLGTTFGSTDAAMQNTTANIVNFAVHAGQTRNEAVQFADGIFAISASAIAANPQIGTLAEVAQRAEIGIGKSRTAASLLNLSLDQTAVSTLAAKIATEEGKDAAGPFEKALAAERIAADLLGPSLKQNIEDGSKNAAVQQRQLKAEFDNFLESAGKQLVVPAFDALKAGIPIAEGLASTLGEIASTVLPPLATALGLIAPLIPPIVEGFLAMKAVDLAVSIATWVTGLVTGAAAWLGFGEAAVAAGAEIDIAAGGIATSEAVATGGLSLLVGAAVAAGVAIVTFGGDENNVTEQTHKMADALKSASADELVRSFEGASIVRNFSLDVGLAASKLIEFKEIANDNVGTGQRLIDSLKAQGVNTDAYQKILDKAVVSVKAHTAAEEANKAAGDAALGIAKEQVSAQDAAAKSAQAAADGSGTWTDALKAQGAASKEAGDELSFYNNQLKATIGLEGDVTSGAIGLADAVQSTADAVTKSGNDFSIFDTTGRANIKTLESQVQAAESLAGATVKQEQATGNLAGAQAKGDAVMAHFTLALHDQLTGFGLTSAAADALITALGLKLPGAASAGAAGLLGIKPAADPAGQAMEAAAAGAHILQQYLDAVDSRKAAENILGIKTASDKVSTSAPVDFAAIAAAANAMGVTIAAGIDVPTAALDSIPTTTSTAMAATSTALTDGGTTAAADAAAAGAGIVSDFASGIAPLPDKASETVLGAGARIQADGTSVAENQAHGAGYGIGEALGTGIYDGMNDQLNAIAQEAASLVTAAEGAARAAAKSKSPSELFAAIGSDIGEGLALGIEGKHGRTSTAAAGLISVAGGGSIFGPPGGGGGHGPITFGNFIFHGVTDPEQAKQLVGAATSSAMDVVERRIAEHAVRSS